MTNSCFPRLIFAVVLLALFSPSSSSALKPPGPGGPYAVGVRVMRAEIDGHVAPFLVWYPAMQNHGEPYLYATGIALAAVQNAAPDPGGGPYPMVLFSHGMGGCAAQHVFINEELASYGYVVVAPDHRESAMCHIDGGAEIGAGRLTWSVLSNNFDLSGVVMDLFGDYMKEIGYDFTYRGREAKDAIDRALEWNADPSSFLRGMIDPDKIGMSGHSLGGYTTLLAGGLPNYCDPEPPPAAECSFEDIGLHNVPNPCCLGYLRGQDPFQYRDLRVKAIFVMSAAVLFPNLERAAQDLEVPIMLVNGDDKKFEVPLEPLQTIYDHAPAPKYLAVLKDTDHMTAADSTLKVSAARLILPGFRANFDQKAQAYNSLCASFFNRHLKGEGPSPALDGPINKFVEMWKMEK